MRSPQRVDPPPSTTAKGRAAESLVLERYLAAGYRELGRNVRCGRLEIDLVLERRGCVVFCEVKARASSEHGHPAEFVDGRKQARIRTAAARFIAETGIRPRACRFDVVSVIGGGSSARVEIYPNAF